jgi:hypothetical protein
MKLLRCWRRTDRLSKHVEPIVLERDRREPSHVGP